MERSISKSVDRCFFVEHAQSPDPLFLSSPSPDPLHFGLFTCGVNILLSL